MKFVALFLVVVLLVIAGLGAWLYTPDRSGAALRAKYDDEATSYISLAGILLRVRETGPKDAPAVILLHGFGASLETWEPWSQTLSRHYRVIAFDLPGFGLTGPDPAGDYSDRRASALIAALMDHLHISTAVLVGHSLGGRIAWQFAAAYPGRVTKLVLIAPDGFASPGFEYNKPPEIPVVMRMFPYTLPGFMLRANLVVAYADPRKLTPAIFERYQDFMLAPGDRQAMLTRMAQTVLTDPQPILRKIQCQTLILWGAKDGMIPIANAADYERDIPHATVVTLAALGHVPFEEAPAESLVPVLAFLAAPAAR